MTIAVDEHPNWINNNIDSLSLYPVVDEHLPGINQPIFINISGFKFVMMQNPEPLYVNLATESEDPDVTEIESLCVQCHSMGTTRLLLTKIPHYKEVILSSFACEECGERNNSVQRSSVQDLGIQYQLKVITKDDLSRQIVQSDHAIFSIVDLDFEIPGRGEITTIEGVITKALDNIKQGQECRKSESIETYEQLEKFISKLEALLNVSSPFTIILKDPSGESFVENLKAPLPDPQLTISTYIRTEGEDRVLGIYKPDESQDDTLKDPDELKGEVLQFNTICDQCSRPTVTKMKVVDVPHFKEVVIMATDCEYCNHRTNEVKSCAGIEEKGQKICLQITKKEDLARDVLKSETCNVNIPELELCVGAGIFVGKFTTVEGLLTDVKDDLTKNPFLIGDSATEDRKAKIESLVNEIQKVIDLKRSVALILDDPAGNSFVQDLYTPEKDPFLNITLFERSFEQNEELGINDMKTENYQEEDGS